MKNFGRVWILTMMAVSAVAVALYAANLAGIVPSASFGSSCKKALSAETSLGVCRLPPLRN
jgi:hypothetical protein